MTDLKQAQIESADELFADYPSLVPGKITYSLLNQIIDWQRRHNIGSVSHSTLDACREEGMRAAQAGLELGLIDYGQASGCEDY